ncbi:MAG: hypothetical protein CJBNEKGG_01776 [Prosthecobacter sp.]|nr:hypothetical protein [Prosthecobacter sp.]
MFRQLPVSLIFLTCLLFGRPGMTWAYLGSFEEGDGYRVPGTGLIVSQFIPGDAQFYLGNNPANGYTGVVAPGAFPNTLGDMTHGADVSRYNAGQFGTNLGGPGGTAADIADNSGLWKALAGGRLNEDLGAPLYQGNTFRRDYVAAYGYSNARTGSQVLNVLATDEDLHYAYQFDERDFNGIAPSLTGSSLMDLTFWTCPSDYDDAESAHVLGMAIKDSLGQTLMEVGYTGDNFLQYRVGGSGAWQTTSINMGTQGWSMISLQIDTAADTVGLSAAGFDNNTSLLGPTTGLFSGQSIGFAAADLATLEWSVAGMVGFKNYFDDFSFSISPTPVPEPGTALMVLLAGLVRFGRAASRRRMESSLD